MIEYLKENNQNLDLNEIYSVFISNPNKTVQYLLTMYINLLNIPARRYRLTASRSTRIALNE